REVGPPLPGAERLDQMHDSLVRRFRSGRRRGRPNLDKDSRWDGGQLLARSGNGSGLSEIRFGVEGQSDGLSVEVGQPGGEGTFTGKQLGTKLLIIVSHLLGCSFGPLRLELIYIS